MKKFLKISLYPCNQTNILENITIKYIVYVVLNYEYIHQHELKILPRKNTDNIFDDTYVKERNK